jgi:The GLUG motif
VHVLLKYWKGQMSSVARHSWRHRLGVCAIAAGLPFFILAGSAHADLVISSAATQNVQCDASKCSATAANAVLNIDQLKNMLAAGKVTVSTAQAAGPNIVVNASLTWASANSLTLDAYTSIVVNAPVTVAGTGGVSLITNDGGYNGTLFIADGGNIAFWGTSNKLAINRIPYMLVNSIEGQAAAVAADRAGFFALSKSYDASVDGTYAAAPVTFLRGTVEGLGNTISNFSINASKGKQLGLIGQTDLNAWIENLRLQNVKIVSRKITSAGGLVGVNAGTLFNDSVSGTVAAPGNSAVGLLVGISLTGIIANAHSSGTVKGKTGGGLVGAADVGSTYILDSGSTASVASPARTVSAAVGGIIGSGDGTLIANSWATGSVTGGAYASAGGLAGYLCGVAIASSSTGAVSAGDNAAVGGLVGNTTTVDFCGSINASYATGNVNAGANSLTGGLIGSCGGPLFQDFASRQVTSGDGGYVGGLVGWALCPTMDQVSATGNVTGGSATGGLVGFNYNSISNAYATGSVTGMSGGDVGGLIGQSVEPVSTSYSTAMVTGNGAKYIGGLIGEDQTQYKYLSSTYWDTTTSGITNPAQGVGNVSNDPGVRGKTDRQLKGALPNGFSSAIWGQSPQINGGLPYLIGNDFASARRFRLRCPARLSPKFAAACWSELKPR